MLTFDLEPLLYFLDKKVAYKKKVPVRFWCSFTWF